MEQDFFKKLEKDETAAILARLNPVFDGTAFDPANTTILAQDLSFYPGYQLLDISNHSVSPAICRYVVYNTDKFFILNFTNKVIYDFNKNLPIVLSETNVAEYVRFFFKFVRGPYGRFLIVQNIDDIQWKDDPPPAARKAVGALITPLLLEETGKDGQYHMSACMIFKDSLFKSTITIDSSGYVSLSNEELLVEDMPVLDDTFGQ